MKVLMLSGFLTLAFAVPAKADTALDRCQYNLGQLGGDISMAVLEVCAQQERQADREIAQIEHNGDQRAIRVCKSMGDFRTMSHAFFMVCYRNEVGATQRLESR